MPDLRKKIVRQPTTFTGEPPVPKPTVPIPTVQAVASGDGLEYYTKPIVAGINTVSFWSEKHRNRGAWKAEHGNNIHLASGERPEHFWITAKNLINFIMDCMGKERPGGPRDLPARKKLYDDAKLNKHYPDMMKQNPKEGQMSWYKFNRTYTTNITRYMGKGISCCFRDEAFRCVGDIRNQPTATCMISYAYDSDPEETLQVLGGLIAKGIIEVDERIFFCSFANFQCNHSFLDKWDDAGKKLQCKGAPTVNEQVEGDPFDKVSQRVDKFIIMHTAKGKDIYERRWCCYELSKAMMTLADKERKSQVFMVGSTYYQQEVSKALTRTSREERFEELFNDNFDLAIYHDKPNEFWENPETWQNDANLAKDVQEDLKWIRPADTRASECGEEDMVKLANGIGNMKVLYQHRDAIQVEAPASLDGFKAADFIVNTARRRYQHIITEGAAAGEMIKVVQILEGEDTKHDEIQEGEQIHLRALGIVNITSAVLAANPANQIPPRVNARPRQPQVNAPPQQPQVNAPPQQPQVNAPPQQPRREGTRSNIISLSFEGFDPSRQRSAAIPESVQFDELADSMYHAMDHFVEYAENQEMVIERQNSRIETLEREVSILQRRRRTSYSATNRRGEVPSRGSRRQNQSHRTGDAAVEIWT